jgi:hypothetical protein
MPRTVKTKDAASKPKIYKSAWIRSQSSSASAKEVLAKATAAGIQLSLAQVYTARSNATKGVQRKMPKPSNAAASNGTALRGIRPGARVDDASAVLAFQRVVFTIGVTQAERMLIELKTSLGV